jgi:hypothetical protein
MGNIFSIHYTTRRHKLILFGSETFVQISENSKYRNAVEIIFRKVIQWDSRVCVCVLLGNAT